ncbi:metallophosphoesterase [Leifsonia sp. ZF2019]|uniref:metallophosphoesterase n=1 Tax=Leifsonia sp. ZF2019 TaxID=2781978 RepID=UPI001CBA75F8|nr:metallophosphoesterase [Leifsonia sp. ZF2019]UAJ79568.1 metallophosphoesterase [Leifsonia sp. ZF2019]
MTLAETPAGLRILHLSDTHLFSAGRLHYGQVDTLAALDRTLARAGSLDTLDLVAATGDLSDDGGEQSYRLLASRLAPFASDRGADLVYAMGNHDLRAGFEAVLGARETVTLRHGFRIVTLDTSVPGAGYGALDTDQLDRLAGILAVPAPHGTIVALHHPPVPASSALLAALELSNPEALLDVCAGGDVRLILGGHYHHALAAQARGIPVVVAPGVANSSDPLAAAGTERAVVGSGFAVVELPAEGEPRVVFLPAPGPDDGSEIFDLDATEVARIADAAGSGA